MKHPIKVWSHDVASANGCDYPYIHISIETPNEPPLWPLKEDPNRKALLVLKFHDFVSWEQATSYTRATGEIGRMMHPTHAEQILDFVEEWKDKVDGIVVNCTMGQSRSAGVAAGLCAVYNWEDDHIYRACHPNVHCKSLIIEEGNCRKGESQSAFGNCDK